MLNWLTVTTTTLSAHYGVNPVVFGLLYFGAMSQFAGSVGWWWRNAREGRPILWPVVTSAVLFVAAYLYVLVAGKNLPVWVYVFMAVMLALGAVTTWKKIQQK